jgi:acetyl esterase/lipase
MCNNSSTVQQHEESNDVAEIVASDDDDQTANQDDTTVITTPPLPPREYYFSNKQIQQMNQRTQDENARLNLNLGMPFDLTTLTRRSEAVIAESDGCGRSIVQRLLLRPPIQAFIRILDLLLTYIESPLFHLWTNYIPLRYKQKLTFVAWNIYLPFHKALLGRKTGIHTNNVSYEYHALTTIMWWGRLFPITIKRMRMSLSQLHVWHPADQYPQWPPPSPTTTLSCISNGSQYGIRGNLTQVYHPMKQQQQQQKHTSLTAGSSSSRTSISSIEDNIVTGQYIQHNPTQPSKKVLLWIYGGAFLAGDSIGNIGIAEKMGLICNERDVFIPDYRLVPEYHLNDAVHDVILAYEYLLYVRNLQPEDIIVVGVSSGGGLVVLLLQALAATTKKNNAKHCIMPAGGVMMGPFVDYTEPKGSMKDYIKHDLIVNQVCCVMTEEESRSTVVLFFICL